MADLISAHKINKFFEADGKHLHVLKDINLEVHAGEFLMLLGPSGSGKSTLLRIFSQLIPPSSGELKFGPDLKTAFIFQDFALFPWLTVYENVEFGLKMANIPQRERHERAKAEIERMGLQGFESSFPRELSGGMKQRVGIARALAIQPHLIFLDEPFSALDSFTAKKLRAELLDIWQEQKLTVVMVTHLIEEALQLGDRVAILSSRPAVIEEIVQNALPRPRNNRSPQFFELADKIEKVIKI